MYSCRKTYSNIPFAHRQHRHGGHCARIHGHNWTFVFDFGCTELDECGFVIDFGKLAPLRDWLMETFDHACAFNRDDPMLPAFLETRDERGRALYKAVVVDECSSEGLARFCHESAQAIVAELSGGRVDVLAVRAVEDSRNSARYAPERP